MTLWDWSARAWSAESVRIAGLDLQDAQGQNIPLLLWAAWLAATGRLLDADLIDAGCDTARVWQDSAVTPLRAVRRALTSRMPDMDDAARETVRAHVKAVELEAERHLLTALEGLSPEPDGDPRPILPALVAVARVWGEITPRAALALLAERLPA